MQLKSDDELFRAYRHGDARAFTTLYERYRDAVYRYIYRSCGRASAADDLFQDVWARVINAARKYEDHNRFRSWLFTCAHHAIVDYYRRQSRWQETALDDCDLSTEDATEFVDVPERVARVLGTLPFEQRQAFHMRESLGCSVAEIAELQGCSSEAAKSRLRYAYAKLREGMGS